jgi:hypothetical protein
MFVRRISRLYSVRFHVTAVGLGTYYPWIWGYTCIYTSITYRFKVPTITEEVTKFTVKYRDKITTHPNELTSTLLEEEEPRRLKRFKPTNLTTRFS